MDMLRLAAAACWISAQRGVLCDRCDTVCQTFQLPHIITGSFQSHQWQPTTGSLQSFQRLREYNKPSVRWKSFAIHNLVWWHFQMGWASWLQFVFFWDNVNNSKYVRTILFKMTFFGFLGVMWLHLKGEVDKYVRFHVKFSQHLKYRKSLKSVNFWQSCSKNKKWTFLGGTVHIQRNQRINWACAVIMGVRT